MSFLLPGNSVFCLKFCHISFLDCVICFHTFQELPLMHILTFVFQQSCVQKVVCVYACHGEVELDCPSWSFLHLKLLLANQIRDKE